MYFHLQSTIRPQNWSDFWKKIVVKIKSHKLFKEKIFSKSNWVDHKLYEKKNLFGPGRKGLSLTQIFFNWLDQGLSSYYKAPVRHD